VEVMVVKEKGDAVLRFWNATSQSCHKKKACRTVSKKSFAAKNI
jgi:hypothetical protein